MKEKIRKYLPALFSTLQYAKGLGTAAYFNLSRRKVRTKILKEFKDSQDPEIKEIVSFLTGHRTEMIPYNFIFDYLQKDIPVSENDPTGYPYAVVNGNKIYFPKGDQATDIIHAIRVGLLEQDYRSPHNYLPEFYKDLGGNAAVICGASDCMFTLKIADRFDKLYLFEADLKWHEPMKLTLKDHLHKVEIIPFFIADQDNIAAKQITLDTFWKERGEPVINFIQADIENYEINLLRGATALIKNNPVRMSVCCYHTAIQQQEVEDFLTAHHMKHQPSMGWVIIWTNIPLRKPFLRKAVIYAYKNQVPKPI